MRSLLIITCLVAACDEGPDGAAPDASPAADPADLAPLDAPLIDAGLPDSSPPDAGPLWGPDRRALLFLPEGEAPVDGWPVLMVLHGFRANPTLMSRQFPFGDQATADGWIVIYPHGARDDAGFPHWRDYGRVEEGPGPDVPYLLELAAAVAARHGGDPDQLFVAGHSNGGAMAQHLACQAADAIRGFVNISGFNVEPARCAPARPISGLYVHGDADGDVPYGGRGGSPGVDEAAAWWAESVLGCAAPMAGPPADFTIQVAEAETAVRRWTDCPEGTVAERWRLQGVGHGILTHAAFTAAVRAALSPRH